MTRPRSSAPEPPSRVERVQRAADRLLAEARERTHTTEHERALDDDLLTIRRQASQPWGAPGSDARRIQDTTGALVDDYREARRVVWATEGETLAEAVARKSALLHDEVHRHDETRARLAALRESLRAAECDRDALRAALEQAQRRHEAASERAAESGRAMADKLATWIDRADAAETALRQAREADVVHLGRPGETSHACGASGGWANFAVLDAVTCVACLRAAVRAERAPDLYDPPAEQRDHDPLVHALATAKVTASDAARHLGAEVVRLRALACDATSKRADPVVLRLEQAAPDLSALRDAGAARGSSPRAERAPEAARPDVVTGAAAGHAGRLDGQHREEQNRRTR